MPGNIRVLLWISDRGVTETSPAKAIEPGFLFCCALEENDFPLRGHGTITEQEAAYRHVNGTMLMDGENGRDKALVLFSGGQDSAVCLAWALDRFEHVETVGFDYRQRHRIELICRQTFLLRMGVRFADWSPRLKADHVLDLGLMSEIGDTAMTHDLEIRTLETGLPNTFVPGRNLMFLTAASALAFRLGISNVIGGMCETDYSGYPDCRRETIEALEKAINLGMASNVKLLTPLMQIDKKATWELAHAIGGDRLIDLIIEETHTCYIGDRDNRHDWGYGCGKCPACELRAKGYHAFAGAREAVQPVA